MSQRLIYTVADMVAEVVAMLLGAHIPVSGGVYKAPERGRALTCDCMQIFSKNQMQWNAKPLSDEDSQKFRSGIEANGIVETVIHDSYLINLASPDEALLRKSREAFLDEMSRAKKLGVRYLIFHPGAHVGSGEQIGIKKIAESLNWARAEFDSSEVNLLLETTAGQGSVLGHSFEQLARIIDLLDEPKSAGVCFDTCHAYAAGYDVRTPKGYEKTMSQLDDVLGVAKLKAMHLNDSKGKLGSRVDRHEEIGKGHIGLDGFRNLMNDQRFENVPMVLETPGGEKRYAQELKTLRALVMKG
ncbi:MAG: deoxyribonuclease IV [Thermoplasmata archaeon]|nr:deoxyribonuclease IV [Thermoplasmata archaeon]